MTLPGNLKWQCRRGQLELDLLLQRYLDTCYPQASAAEQAEFIQSLQLPDAELLNLLLQRLTPQASTVKPPDNR